MESIQAQDDFEYINLVTITSSNLLQHLGGLSKGIVQLKMTLMRYYSQYFSYLSDKIVILTPTISSKMCKKEPGLEIFEYLHQLMQEISSLSSEKAKVSSRYSLENRWTIESFSFISQVNHNQLSKKSIHFSLVQSTSLPLSA